MGDEYALIKYQIPGGEVFWELAKACSSTSEIQKMMANPRTAKSVRNLFAQISKIYDHGIPNSIATSKLRCLDSGLGLYEIKGFDGANREMAYILCKEPPKIVLLRWFRGHSGSGNIHKEIDKVKGLAKAASQLIDKEDEVPTHGEQP